jgi:hypothetical protein
MADILTVGDLIAELSKHPADAPIRIWHDDGEWGPDAHGIGDVFKHSDEKEVMLETGPTPEQKRAAQDLRQSLGLDPTPSRTFARCNADDAGAEQRMVSGNLLWVRPKS